MHNKICTGKKIPARMRGFTMVELIAVMIIVGVLAAVAMPRFFDRNSFDSRGFSDTVKTTLRHAQKVAIAQRHFVCAAMTASSITLTLDTTAPGATHTTATCPGAALTSPKGDAPYTVIVPSNVTMSGYAPFSFDALGKPSIASMMTITIAGAPSVTVEAETGYVH